MHQILLRAEISFRRLHRSVPEEQLNLLQLSSGRPTQLRARSPQIVWSDALHSHGFRIALKQLPDDLLAQRLATHLIAAMHRPENPPINDTGLGCPGIDRNLHPRGHRNRSDSPVLSFEIHDAPATIPLLNVAHRHRGNLRTSEPTTQEHRQDRAVAKSLLRGRIGSIQQRLRLFYGQPVPEPYALRCDTLYAR